ncbi:MAG: endonuclease domain-containing protein [Ignavibacteria bacterium]|jgi:very-short-patch-repair endonuclease
MTKHYNKKSQQEKRRYLRNNMTYTEKIVWAHIRKRQLGYRFLRQYSVDHYVIDFYCPELKLALEIDGGIHELPENKEYDEARQKYIEGFGIKFLRIKNEEILGNANKAFDKIINEIKTIGES